MNLAFRRVLPGAILGPFLLLTISLSSAQDATPPGVLWEVTSQMSMEGMPMMMPARTMKVCAKRDWTEPPGASGEQGCTSSAFEQVENTVTWTSTCPAPMEMAGRGEITFEDDSAQAYTGKIEYSGDHGLMTIDLTGHVIGACDHPQ